VALSKIPNAGSASVCGTKFRAICSRIVG